MSSPPQRDDRAAPQVGSWVKLPTAMSIEVLFDAGADFVCIDMCNGWFSLDQVNELLAHRTPATARYVRLPPDGTPAMIGQLFDAGADGVVVPHVHSVEHARQMVAGALFGPHGTRGMGSTGRAGRWGLAPSAGYLDSGRVGGALPVITLMVESSQAVDAVDELAAIPGVTQLLIGSADLGAELGHDADRLAHAADAVVASCVRHGLSAAIATGNVDQAAPYLARGFDAVYLSNDLSLLARSAQRCFAALRVVGGAPA